MSWSILIPWTAKKSMLEFQGLDTSLRIESGYMLSGNVALRSASKFCMNVIYVFNLCSMMFIISFSLNC